MFKDTPRIDDICMINDAKVNQSQWRIGHVKELIKSSGNLLRSARVAVMTNDGKKSDLHRTVNIVSLDILKSNKH